MKTLGRSLNLLTFAIILILYKGTVANLYSQDLDLDNNARKVISIYEDRFASKSVKLIYDAQRPFIEKVPYVDNRSDIVIYIDREALTKFDDFLGSVSLTARINDRLIEVSPYSEVGKELKTVGVNGVNSTRDFALSLFNFIVQTSKFNTDIFCGFTENYERLLDDENKQLHIDDLKIVISEIDSLLKDSSRPADRGKILTYVNGKYPNLYGVLSRSYPPMYDSTTTIYDITRIRQSYISQLQKMEKDMIDSEFMGEMFRIQTRLKLLQNYLDYLSNSNIETSRAYSKSIQRDPIFVTHISQIFSSAISKFNSMIDTLNKDNGLSISAMKD